MKQLKVLITTIPFTFVFLFAFLTEAAAQWKVIGSGTGKNLNGLFFLDPDYGVAVGDTSTVLLTTDGGDSWLPIASRFKENFQSAVILEKNVVLIAGGNFFEGNVYRTTNGGFDWSYVTPGIALSKSDEFIFSLDDETIYKSFNQGAGWKPSVIIIGSTTVLEELIFPATDVGYTFGNIGGVATYSTFAYRSNDAGDFWYPFFETDFPNADAFTAAFFTHPDTGFVFTNEHDGFLPGSSNKLIRVTNFRLEESNLIKNWRFDAEMINDAMPAFITDAHFLSKDLGFAAGADGNIYKTIDGGVTWKPDYEGDTPLRSIIMVDGNTGYAAGDAGTLLKFTGMTTAVRDPAAAGPFRLFPTPACGMLNVEGPMGKRAEFRLFNEAGQLVRQSQINGHGTIGLNGLPGGFYAGEFRFEGNIYLEKVVVQGDCE